MTPFEKMLLIAHFVRTRWMLGFTSRKQLEAFQKRQLARFLARELAHTAYYRSLGDLPLEQLSIVDKSVMLGRFSEFNSAGISLEQATEVALEGENSRDFGKSLQGMTVGLSSGTQGPRGIFLAAPRERAKWAGILLARVLSGSLLRDLLFRPAPLRVAFFLRANSNLYTTLNSRRIDFRFHDLFLGIEPHLAALAAFQPDILVAPARILGRLAELAAQGELTLAPRHVIAVAEVLEPDDRSMIERAFGLTVHQLYQCTEGFLGYTCAAGTLHLNEEFVHFEKEWIDDEKTRFVPIVTDFSRNTQLIVRYRLNDILRVRATACPCGSASTALAAIEGRSDDILHVGEKPIFPDMVRHAITTASTSLPDYRIVQRGAALYIAVADRNWQSYQAVVSALVGLFDRLGVSPPAFVPMEFAETAPHAKRRRILCEERPCAQS